MARIAEISELDYIVGDLRFAPLSEQPCNPYSGPVALSGAEITAEPLPYLPGTAYCALDG